MKKLAVLILFGTMAVSVLGCASFLEDYQYAPVGGSSSSGY